MKNFLTKMQYQLNLQVKFIISTIGTLLLIIMGSYIVGLAILMCIITLLKKIPFSITYFFYFFLCFFLILITFIISRHVSKKIFLSILLTCLKKKTLKLNMIYFFLHPFVRII